MKLNSNSLARYLKDEINFGDSLENHFLTIPQSVVGNMWHIKESVILNSIIWEVKIAKYYVRSKILLYSSKVGI